jgi:hypothetical protein
MTTTPGLRELQTGFRAALLDGDERVVTAAIGADGLGSSARLAVYRHHVFASLTAALESTYPVVARLVDPRFFRYAAHRYVHDHPPSSPCLFDYGAALPDFLAAFEPCRHLAYLPDVARLEWAMNAALHAPEAPAIAPEALRTTAVVALHPSVTLLTSAWPVDAIWRSNQPGVVDDAVDLRAGTVRLQVWRAGDEVVFRGLSPAAFAFRAGLARTGRLEHAAEAALGADPAADLVTLVREVLDDEVLV